MYWRIKIVHCGNGHLLFVVHAEILSNKQQQQQQQALLPSKEKRDLNFYLSDPYAEQ